MNPFAILALCLLAMGFIWFIIKIRRFQIRPRKSLAKSTQSIPLVDITEIKSFRDIHSELGYADHNTLVIFDVDEVLITYDDMVLRPCGAHFCPSSWKGIDPKQVPYLISIMLNKGKIILVEPSAPRVINKLKTQGAKALALTAAQTGKFGVIQNAENWRLKTLKQFNLDFSNSFSKIQIMYFDKEEGRETDYPIFKNGVLFLGNEKNSKGTLLVKFLERIQWKPNKVIFIDDKMANLISVQSALKQGGIPFQGYQYKGVTQLPGEFNEQIAEMQFARLRKDHQWLSDSEAKKEERNWSNSLPL